jgi:hypothetical protein
MGITKTDCTLLFHAKKLQVNFEKTCMLGRLQLYASRDDIRQCLTKFQNGEKDLDAVEFPDGYSEPLFKILGAKEVESMDFSAYEKATIIADLNNPVPTALHNRFTCVLDSGTLEHIFNFPVAIKNCMEMVQVGGHFIGITPGNNQMGHGFYQFSPELFYRIFSEENGFRMVTMLIAVEHGENKTDWYEVADPKEVNNRVMLVNNIPVSLMIIARKTANKDIFSVTPQQSDYTATWDAYTSVTENKVEASGSRLKFIYRKMVPYRMKIILRNLYDIYNKGKVDAPGLGTINPDYFKKTEL